MKIKELKISNILSFKYYEDITDATKIIFDDNLNIFIGENGAGKSTALEVINFLFKKVLFTQFNINQDLYSRKSILSVADRKQILSPANNQSFSDFRLDPNWNTENSTQRIQLLIELDEIDKVNINHLVVNKEKLNTFISSYTNYSTTPDTAIQNIYTIEVILNNNSKTFSTNISPNASDPGYLYLVNYNFYKELINFYNFENPQDQIAPLYESFTLIGGYRNYQAFNPAVSLQGSSAAQQIQQIKIQEYSKSLNANEQSEPSIFNLVRLRVAGKHFEIYGEDAKGMDCEKEANDQEFLLKINKKLKLVNLEVKIEFTNKQKWGYSFQFYDLKRQKPLTDINSLSAGQKAIIHLLFEAYGRGDLKGGLVIIDEPEIHLHYQFQNEYLHVIDEINKEQKCQYVLVTHSESLINSITIHKVKRFALDEDNNTVIKTPKLSTNQKTLIKILDNTRSTYAFFAKKVLLVEGETDRYFFRAALQEIQNSLNQEIAILDITGKRNYSEWKAFFEEFGLSVYFIGDLDSAFGFLYSGENAYKLNSPEIIKGFKCTHPNIDLEIDQKYIDKVYILKEGDLEYYLDINNKGLPETIKFCNEKLKDYLDVANNKSKEIRTIFSEIIK
ncbi:MAG: AAA family ATPase [Candidatus Paceibacterota bacterium]